MINSPEFQRILTEDKEAIKEAYRKKKDEEVKTVREQLEREFEEKRRQEAETRDKLLEDHKTQETIRVNKEIKHIKDTYGNKERELIKEISTLKNVT
jgi:O6-methylguanine-DNA--protein-cysteine methyltransferase